mgnify:CR=1 FL=1
MPFDIEFLRGIGNSGRFAIAMELSKAAIEGQRDALRRSHPELTEREVLRLWVSLYYGEDLARRVFDRGVQGPGACPSSA